MFTDISMTNWFAGYRRYGATNEVTITFYRQVSYAHCYFRKRHGTFEVAHEKRKQPVCNVFPPLNHPVVTLHPGKIFSETCDKSGFAIHQDSLQIASPTSDELQNLKTSTFLTNLLLFFRPYNFFKQIVSNFANVAPPTFYQFCKNQA